MLTAQNLQQSQTENFTFAQIPNWLMRREELDSDSKVVYARIAQYARETGSAFPTRETLSEQCGMSVQKIDRALKKLNNVNLVLIERRGKNKSNVYTLVKDHIWMKDARKYSKPIPQKGVIKSDNRELSNLITPYKDEEITRKDNIIQGKKDFESSQEIRKEFDKFWGVYPRKQEKEKAIPAYLESRKHVSFETLMRKAKSYARQRERIDSIARGKDYNSNQDLYTKLPHNWLASHGWEDDYGRDEVMLQPIQQVKPLETKLEERPGKKLTPQEADSFFLEIKKQIRAA